MSEDVKGPVESLDNMLKKKLTDVVMGILH